MNPNIEKNNSKRNLALVAGAAVLVLATGAYAYYSAGTESTDDAFLEGHVIQVSPRVAGQIAKVYVEDNQHVKTGELIAEIDAADYQTKLDDAAAALKAAEARAAAAGVNVGLTSVTSDATLTQANAALAGTRNQADSVRARYAQDQAGVEVSKAALEQAQARETAAVAEADRAASDAVRYRQLFEKDEVSRQTLDRAETTARTTAADRAGAAQAVAAAKAQLAQAHANAESTAASIRQMEKAIQQAAGRQREASTAPQQVSLRQHEFELQKAAVESARAAYEQAKLNLSYTKIYATEAGTITRKAVEPGTYVAPGQALAALVADRLWVIANFKETQIQHMHPGQAVTVKVDAYPHLKLHAKLDSIQRGTGSRFSLLPAENATGNYVKVVQRVPVKIVLNEDAPEGVRLGPGMSVEPVVEVR